MSFNPFRPERYMLSYTDFSHLRRKHLQLQRKAGHKLIDMGYSVVVFDYAIVLKRKKWRRLDKERWTWGIGKIANVIGFRRGDFPNEHEICWVECGDKIRTKIFLQDSDLLEFLKSCEGYNFRVLYCDWEGNFREVWNSRMPLVQEKGLKS